MAKPAPGEPITIGNEEVFPGEDKALRLNVGRLPSGTRIQMSLHCYRSENPGPIALVLGGVHGDEINGIEIVRKSIETGVFNNLLRGSVIAIPILNIYGFINFSREVPDGKDVNRSFPGNLKGSLASRVARSLTRIILPYIDFGMDFHTGGNSRFNYPQIRYSGTDSMAKEMAQQFAAPYTIKKANISKSLRKVAKDMGIPMLVYEGGESLRLDGFVIESGIKGLKRVLHSKEMIQESSKADYNTVHFNRTSWIRAPYSGIFIWSRESGVYVHKGEPLGTIKDPFGIKSVTVLSNREGYIIGHNNNSVVNQGDALFHIGYDVSDF
jgi:predicted deacylase